MTAWQLSIQFLVAFVALIAANVAIQQTALNSVPRQLIRRGVQSETATDLFLGNSTVAAGLDENAFKTSQPNRRPLNAGLGFSSPVEHLIIYRTFEKHRRANVYYGFLDTQLTDPPEGGWDSLVGNRAMAYYVDIDLAIRFYAPNSRLGALAIRAAAQVPAIVERYGIWARVEWLRRLLSEVGMPKAKTNQFGRVADFALLEANPTEFAQRCRRTVDGREELSGPIREMIATAKERGDSIHFVEMPVTSQHRGRFYDTHEWTLYRSHLMRLIRNAGGVYVSAADWVEDDGYSDHLHLNASGARAFSVRLGQWVAQNH